MSRSPYDDKHKESEDERGATSGEKERCPHCGVVEGASHRAGCPEADD